jgi:hypothetical protein
MKREDRLFLLGLVSLILSLFLFPFVVYLFPAIWLGWEYSIPEFFQEALLWFEVTFHTTYDLAFLWLFRLTFFAAVVFGVIAYLISHHITKLQAEINKEEDEEALTFAMKAKEGSRESVLFFLKMVVIIGLVFVVSDMIQWAISFSPKAQ